MNYLTPEQVLFIHARLASETASPADLEALTLKVAVEGMRIENLADWLRSHSRRNWWGYSCEGDDSGRWTEAGVMASLLRYLQHTSRKVGVRPQRGGVSLWQGMQIMIAPGRFIV